MPAQTQPEKRIAAAPGERREVRGDKTTEAADPFKGLVVSEAASAPTKHDGKPYRLDGAPVEGTRGADNENKLG